MIMLWRKIKQEENGMGSAGRQAGLQFSMEWTGKSLQGKRHLYKIEVDEGLRLLGAVAPLPVCPSHHEALA